MRNQSFYQLLVLFLTGACIFWAGCEPPETTCDDAYDSLGYSEYCSPPQTKVFSRLNADETIGGILPNGCSTNYSQSRTVKIPVMDQSQVITIHQFINFPGIVVTEIFGTNCTGTFTPLLNDCSYNSKVVTVFEVEASNYSTIYVRVLYAAESGYVLDGESENITIAAYIGQPGFEVFETVQTDNGTERIFRNCDNSATNRIILSGPNAQLTALSSGLPVTSCACSNDQLVTISAPAGVDLNTLRPKVREKPAEPDTTNTYPDLIIAAQNLNFTNFGDNPANDENLTGNSCLSFSAPNTGSGGNNSVVVTVVDSGVDIATHGDIFAANGYQNPATNCLEFSVYGTDLTTGDDFPDDEIGHGTAVASAVISGYDRNRPLTVINNKFFNSTGGSLFNALCGGYAGIEAGSHIINLSWGFKSQEEPAAMKTFLDYARDQNVAIVASAGNRGEFINDFFYWPALFSRDYANMITVASYKYSNTSPQVEMKTDWTNFSPFDVQVAALYARECLQRNGTVWYPAGTSISAPIVTNQLAILKADNYSFSAVQLVNEFLNSDLLSTKPSMLDATIGGRFLGRPSPSNNCVPINFNF